MTTRERVARNLRYIEQLEAHMDEDGKTGPNNVRDLIQMVRETSELISLLEAQIAELRDAIKNYLAQDWLNKLGQCDAELSVSREQVRRLREALSSWQNLVKIAPIDDGTDPLDGLPDSHLFELAWADDHDIASIKTISAGQIRRARTILAETEDANG